MFRPLARLILAGLDLALLGLILLLVRLLAQPALLPLTLFGLVLALLFGVLLAAAAQHWETRWSTRLTTAVGALAGSLLLVKGGLDASYLPLGGWSLLTQTLLNSDDPHFGWVYIALLIALVAIYRGTQLRTPTALVEVQDRFKRGLFMLIALLVIAILLPPPYRRSARGAATGAAILYATTGLLAQALFGEASGSEQGKRLRWRKFVLLLGAISLPLAVTLVLAGQFSAEVSTLLTRAYQAIVALILWLIAPVEALIFSLLGTLFRMLFRPAVGLPEPPLPLPRPTPTLTPFFSATPLLLPAWLEAVLPFLPLLIPLLALLLLFVIRPRRARRALDTTEERESVWSWQAAGRDLRAWWQQRRRDGSRAGMIAALSGLQGDNPVYVIRRTYLRLLLRTAQQSQGRDQTQTPAEYQPALDRIFPTQTAAVAAVTHSYEQARYHPEATTAADAATTLRAWEQLASVPLQPPHTGEPGK